jgi:hypothetical protein
MEPMEIENNGCPHVLHLIDTYHSGNSDLLIEISINLEEYPLLCELLMPRRIKSLSMMVVHLMGEELKKRLPYHVSKIEQERVKYLMAIQSLQRVTFKWDLNRVYLQKIGKVSGCR